MKLPVASLACSLPSEACSETCFLAVGDVRWLPLLFIRCHGPIAGLRMP